MKKCKKCQLEKSENCFYPKSPNVCKECKINYQTQYNKEYGKLNKSYKRKSKSKEQDYYSSNIFRIRIYAAQRRAKEKGLDIDINIPYIKNLFNYQGGLCAYSGIEMTKEKGPFSLSIDRIDSNKGYTRDNVQIICSCLNSMKKDLSNDDFVNVLRKVSQKIENFVGIPGYQIVF